MITSRVEIIESILKEHFDCGYATSNIVANIILDALDKLAEKIELEHPKVEEKDAYYTNEGRQ